MIFSGFSLAKLLSGFAVWKGEALGKLEFMVLVIAVCLAIFWRAFLKQDAPVDQSTQQAETITNITQVEEGYLIDLKLGPFKLGLF